MGVGLRQEDLVVVVEGENPKGSAATFLHTCMLSVAIHRLENPHMGVGPRQEDLVVVVVGGEIPNRSECTFGLTGIGKSSLESINCLLQIWRQRYTLSLLLRTFEWANRRR